ncbi:hypothetical protein ACJMK2_022363 [Sinanodonta woodiana]|uniref:G-protein coupled receptors family 1 profile domain-containing protein n=1 Tax=Sinanodonta woodiana TaxID=1069815 RepID=A0ABD3TIT8_SINWO
MTLKPSTNTTEVTNFSVDFNDTDWWCDSIFDNMSLCKNSSNQTTLVPPFELPHPMWLTVALGTLATIVCLITVCGNILVLLSFFLERTIRQPTNYFIASLAVSDLLIGTFSMPCFTLYLLLGYWPLGEIVCDLWLSLDWTVCLASQYTVFFITADRFFSVKLPAKYRNWRTERKVRVMIALSWTVPTFVFFTSIVGWQYFVGKRTVAENACEVQFMSDPLFVFMLTIGYYWTTLSVMCGLYVGIYRVALSLQRKSEVKQKKMSHAMEMSADQKQNSKRGGAPKKNTKKRTENNNARYLRAAGTETTSFSRHGDSDYSKPSEEDRSSSPAFASDDEEGSSGQENHHQHKGGNFPSVEIGYVNSAVQTDISRGPTLKGMLGSSFGHVSRLAFSISGTSMSGAGKSIKDVSEDHQVIENLSKNPLVKETYKLNEEDKDADKSHAKSRDEPGERPSSPLLENDVLMGFKYIDEDSLKSLTSAENVKLLADIGDKKLLAPTDENESPVWRKRSFTNESVPCSDDLDKDDSELIEIQFHDPSRGGPKSHSSSGCKPNSNHQSINNKDKKHGHAHSKSSNHSRSSKSKQKHNKDVPNNTLQSLVKSLRPKNENRDKARKSKSENRARKALRTISIILGAYVLCWTPYHIMVFIIGLCNNWSCINLQLYYFTYWLCYLNSPINPFCYAFANMQFKKTFLRILKLDLHKT